MCDHTTEGEVVLLCLVHIGSKCILHSGWLCITSRPASFLEDMVHWCSFISYTYHTVNFCCLKKAFVSLQTLNLLVVPTKSSVQLQLGLKEVSSTMNFWTSTREEASNYQTYVVSNRKLDFNQLLLHNTLHLFKSVWCCYYNYALWILKRHLLHVTKASSTANYTFFPDVEIHKATLLQQYKKPDHIQWFDTTS